MRRLVPIVLFFVLWVPTARAWTWPVQGPVLQGFVFDASDPYAAGQHRGIDIGAAAGAPVVAPAGGTVAFAGTVPTSGRTVTIDTVDGLAVTLTHLGTVAVAKDAAVSEGGIVGTVGSSGTPATGAPYVHLGIRTISDENGYLDPLALLPVDASSPERAPVEAPAPAVQPAPSVEAGQSPPPAPASPAPPGAQPEPVAASPTAAAGPGVTAQPATGPVRADLQPAQAGPTDAPAGTRLQPAVPASVGVEPPATESRPADPSEPRVSPVRPEPAEALPSVAASPAPARSARPSVADTPARATAPSAPAPIPSPAVRPAATATNLPATPALRLRRAEPAWPQTGTRPAAVVRRGDAGLPLCLGTTGLVLLVLGAALLIRRRRPLHRDPVAVVVALRPAADGEETRSERLAA